MIYEYIFSLGVYVAALVEPEQGQTNSEIVSQPTTASGSMCGRRETWTSENCRLDRGQVIYKLGPGSPGCLIHI